MAGKRVLVVDDEKLIVKGIRFSLEQDNMEVADGNDVINMIEINTTPGMTATSFIPQQVRAAGLDIKDVLTDIVENQF